MRTAGEEGRQFLEALNTPGASVTLTVPRGFLDTPRDWGPQMDSLLTYNWANPHPHSSPEDMARTAMDWVKSQPGSNRDLLRIIAEEIYQGYRGQENGQDNAIQAVRNFLVSVAAIEDFDNLNELDTVTGRSRVLDAVYHSLIEVARTDPRLLVAWLEQISAVDTTNEQGQHVGRAVWTEQGEVVEGGYNLQAGIDTIAALAELTNYPEVLDVLKDQLSGLLKANRALEHERYLVLSHKALGKLLPELDLEGVNLFHANLTNANLSGANLTRANLNGAILNGVNLNGVNLNGADLQNTSLSRANLTSANLTGANLSRANLSGADLRGANLSGAILNRVNLSGADLNGVNLT
ncbi:MAG: pentapeptide repeat-containing protein, partial [Microcystis sp. M020S1]|nr:pentapeptide repeat-containing protein [Microcystis sp. M020S1]